jgi:hypothetical protein
MFRQHLLLEALTSSKLSSPRSTQSGIEVAVSRADLLLPD